ncbi:hypothetical protein ACN28S_16925 [Cystobacter fuscus]
MRELGSEFRIKFPLGMQTSKHTNEFDAWAKFNKTRTTFALDQFNSSKWVTAGGVEWKTVHQDQYSLKMVLTGSYSFEKNPMTGSGPKREASYRLESTGKRFTVTADAAWLPDDSERPTWSWRLRFLYHFH